MEHQERTSGPDLLNEENLVEKSLIQAGLLNVKAPKVGTKAYERLEKTAKSYIFEVKKGVAASPLNRVGDSENYFAKQPASGSSDAARREYHDQLILMILGVDRSRISKREADMVSNFAAYLTGNEEYVDIWSKKFGP